MTYRWRAVAPKTGFRRI